MFCSIWNSREVASVTVVRRASIGNTNTAQSGHVIDNSINIGPVLYNLGIHVRFKQPDGLNQLEIFNLTPTALQRRTMSANCSGVPERECSM